MTKVPNWLCSLKTASVYQKHWVNKQQQSIKYVGPPFSIYDLMNLLLCSSKHRIPWGKLVVNFSFVALLHYHRNPSLSTEKSIKLVLQQPYFLCLLEQLEAVIDGNCNRKIQVQDFQYGRHYSIPINSQRLIIPLLLKVKGTHKQPFKNADSVL